MGKQQVQDELNSLPSSDRRELVTSAIANLSDSDQVDVPGREKLVVTRELDICR
jgi:hypothetical protein